MNALTTDELDEMLGRDTDSAAPQLVDVLGADHYARVHLPGAKNIPLKQLDSRAPEELDEGRPVVVYCASEECGMSPKAAKMLEARGFEDVYDFEGGIAAWRRSGRSLVRGEEVESA